MNAQIQTDMLRGAELQFRLAVTVHLATTVRKQTLDVPVSWTYGQHNVSYDEIALTHEGADFAARLFKKSATYLMAMQIQEALTWFSGGQARSHSDPDVRCAFEIARLIRNSFAHHPLHPQWSIETNLRGKVFSIPDVISLDTANLHGKDFDWRDYGGPLAILKFSQHVRCKILGDDNEGMARKKREPKVTYRQQGNVILEQLK